jgi:hypothetical protein
MLTIQDGENAKASTSRGVRMPRLELIRNVHHEAQSSEVEIEIPPLANQELVLDN